MREESGERRVVRGERREERRVVRGERRGEERREEEVRGVPR